MKKLLILIFIVWFLIGIYGIFYNISFVDEAKYLIKGHLIFKGEISYYNTVNFPYQHMPGSLLWFGLGQKIFGPNLLIGRLQAFLIGLLVAVFLFILANKIKGFLAGLFALALVTLSPITILYYSSATPTSLIPLLFILGFLFLYTKKFFLSSLFFVLLFIVRENFLFTLIFYFLFLLYVLRKDIKTYFLNLVFSSFILLIFFLPGCKVINILKNIPGFNYLLPIPIQEKLILSLNWQKDLHTQALYLKAIAQFWSIYQLWILLFALVIFLIIIKELFKKKEKPIKNLLFFIFLIFITFFNFIAHCYAAFNFSPRTILHYFSYFTPLFSLILALLLTDKLKKLKLNSKNLFIFFLFFFVFFAIPSLREASIFVSPFKKPTLFRIERSVKQLKKTIPIEKKVVWIAEPLPFYMSGGKTYYPLINHINFYKPSHDTNHVRKLGFWNKEILENWLNETEDVFIDPNKINLLMEAKSSRELAIFLKRKLEKDYQLITVFDEKSYLSKIMHFKKKNLF